MIIKEDGSQVAGANSYITEAELATYALDRGVTLAAAASVLIYKAMDYLETLQYAGTRVSDTQPLSWPRSGVYVDGVEVASDEIPARLVSAQLALCVSIDEGSEPDAVLGQAVKSETVDVISVTYQDGSVAAPVLRKVNNMLRLLLSNSGTGGASFNVVRG